MRVCAYIIRHIVMLVRINSNRALWACLLYCCAMCAVGRMSAWQCTYDGVRARSVHDDIR